MNLSSLIYLLFPIIAFYTNDNKGQPFILIIVLCVFIFAYSTLILCHPILKERTAYLLLVIHYLGIIYFVYAINPTTSLFLFYSAFALPFSFHVTIRSKAYVTFMITMILCLITTYLFYPEPYYIITLLIFYTVINIIMFSNFKTAENARYKAQLKAQNDHINVLIADQERNRIGQDLHDTLGHVFASLSLKSELALKLIDHDIKKAKTEVEAINQISKEALTQIRAIINDLKLLSFEEEVASLEQLLKNANLTFHFENAAYSHALSPTKQALLSMILREAINNVIKHAEATEVSASLSHHAEGIILTICDNGKGLNDADVHLQSIEDRIALLRGTLKIENHSGLQLTIFVPNGGGIQV